MVLFVKMERWFIFDSMLSVVLFSYCSGFGNLDLVFVDVFDMGCEFCCEFVINGVC